MRLREQEPVRVRQLRRRGAVIWPHAPGGPQRGQSGSLLRPVARLERPDLRAIRGGRVRKTWRDVAVYLVHRVCQAGIVRSQISAGDGAAEEVVVRGRLSGA